MKNRYSRIPASAALALLISSTFAQGQVDIGLQQNAAGQLEVKVRPAADFDGVFSSIVFTLRWDKNSDLTVGSMLPSEAASYLNMAKSGNRHEDGTFDYQVYAGFGFNALNSVGAHWEAGKEYTIATIPVTGKGSVELVNDAWTSTPANNGDFFVSLGGAERTGVIYKSLATTADIDGTVTIQPNPNEGRFTFSFSADEPGDVRVELMNTLGQAVYSDLLKGFEGTFKKEMDLTHMSDGIYYLKITRGENTSVHKVVYH